VRIACLARLFDQDHTLVELFPSDRACRGLSARPVGGTSTLAVLALAPAPDFGQSKVRLIRDALRKAQ
jgi:hypothetical protein